MHELESSKKVYEILRSVLLEYHEYDHSIIGVEVYCKTTGAQKKYDWRYVKDAKEDDDDKKTFKEFTSEFLQPSLIDAPNDNSEKLYLNFSQRKATSFRVPRQKTVRIMNEESNDRLQQLQPGMSIGSFFRQSSTLGAIVYRGEKEFLLGSWHSMSPLCTPDQMAPEESNVFHPGISDSELGRPRCVAYLSSSNTPHYWGDAAIAEVDKDALDRYDMKLDPRILGLYPDISITQAWKESAVYDLIGKKLSKVGRTTGLTEGEVVSVGTYILDYAGLGKVPVSGLRIIPIGLNSEISLAGDSGAMWFYESEGEYFGVGLHVDGDKIKEDDNEQGPQDNQRRTEEEFAFACHLEPVLSKLGISLKSEAKTSMDETTNTDKVNDPSEVTSKGFHVTAKKQLRFHTSCPKCGENIKYQLADNAEEASEKIAEANGQANSDGHDVRVVTKPHGKVAQNPPR